MAIVVVGGHSRNVGKTSIVAGLIDGLREMRWTAIKITQFGHGVCSANGEPCACETADHAVGISEERLSSGTDSGRYVKAGAERVLWVRTRQGDLIEAMPRLRREIEGAQNTLIESNSILRFLRPDLYLSVLDPGVDDFKDSARRYLDCANAILVPEDSKLETSLWKGVAASLYRRTPVLRMKSPGYITGEILKFVRDRLLESDRRNEAEPEVSGRAFQ